MKRRAPSPRFGDVLVPGGRAYAWKADGAQRVFTRNGRQYTKHPARGVVRVLADFTSEGVRRIVWRRTGRV